MQPNARVGRAQALRILGVILAIVASTVTVAAQPPSAATEVVAAAQLEQQQQTISFSQSDLAFSRLIGGDQVEYDLVEASLEGSVGALTAEPGSPALPVCDVQILLPHGAKVASMRATVGEERVLDGTFNICPAQPAHDPSEPVPPFVQPDPGVYGAASPLPGKVAELADTVVMRGFHVAVVRVYPLSYVPATGQLSLRTSITLELDLSHSRVTPSYAPDASFAGFVKEGVINPDAMPASETALAAPVDLSEVKYLLITNEELEPYFQPLLDWKTKKGVPAEALTTEYIYSHYSGDTNQRQIKEAIKDYAQNRGTVWVALAGDTGIVPTYGCYCQISDNPEDYALPTDLYYAGLDSMDWNGDGDDKACETLGEGGGGDVVDLGPDVFIGRLSVRSADDVNAIVNKTLAYEKNPPDSDFAKKMLLVGVRMWNTGDAHQKLESLWNSYIQPYWDGTHYRFYDDATDFPGGASYDVTAANLSAQIEAGYNFMEFSTHGSATSWGMESRSFSATNALNLVNPGRYINITSSACQTNQFDGTRDPCLGEAFLRNPNGGAVSYIAASRVAWEDLGEAHGPALKYSRMYYQFLFTGQPAGYAQQVGAAFAMAKQYWTGEAGSNSQMRWLQFCLNLLGDPELPLYTQDPSLFAPSYEDAIPPGPQLYAVETGVPYARVALSKGSDVYVYGLADASGHFEAAINPQTSGTMAVTVTKPDYRPYESTVTVNPDLPPKPPVPIPEPTPRPTCAPQPSEEVVFFDNFGTDLGWIVNPNGTDTATLQSQGQWERATPEQTTSWAIIQVGFAASKPFCLVTGAPAGANVYANDVDGVTTVRSPAITLPADVDELRLSFGYYMAHVGDSSPGNYLRLWVEGSTTEDVLEDHGRPYYYGEGYWGGTTLDLTRFAGQTIHLLFEAIETGADAGVEAAVDDVLIVSVPHRAIGETLSADEGSSLEDTIATFADSNLTGPTSDYAATIDWGDGSNSAGTIRESCRAVLSIDRAVDGSHVYVDQGTYNVMVSAFYKGSRVATGVSTVSVANVAPAVGPIEAPASPVLLNTPISASAVFTDPGVLDTHTAVWDWGDGSTSPGVVDEVDGSGSVSGNHTYTAVGPYTITLTVTDKDGGAGEATLAHQVVYGFSGFSQPVDDPPALNVANAGQTIPLVWRITDADGTAVTDLESVLVTVADLDCAQGTSVDEFEEYAAGASGLQNLGDGYYQFNWKTPKTYAQSCKMLKLDLGEGPGMERTALFQFK